MKIKDIQYINKLKPFKLIAGINGLENRIRNVVIFEYDDNKNYEENYYDHDFIISSLIFAKEHPEMIVAMLKKMIDLGASAIAVKRAYYQELPEEVLRYADKRNLPLFVFDKIYMEDVIISISGYIQHERLYLNYQSELRRMLFETPSARDTEQYCYTMNTGYLHFMCACYLEPLRTNPYGIENILHALGMRSLNNVQKDFRFYQYQNGIFILWNTSQKYTHKDCLLTYHALIEHLGCSSSDFTIGFSEFQCRRDCFSTCFFESYSSWLYTQFHEIPSCFYDDIGIQKWLYPVLFNFQTRRQIYRICQLLEQYDSENHQELTYTVCTYAVCHCEIKETARILCQHSNTIRYRLHRIMELCNTSSPQEFNFLSCLISEYLYISQISEFSFK